MKTKTNAIIVLFSIAVLFLFFFLIVSRKNNEQIVNQTKSSTEKQSESQLLANKAKCQKDGQQFYDKKREKEKESIKGSYYYTVYGNYSFAFNKDLNTCLIAWEEMSMFMEGANGYALHDRKITDIYSNNDVYSWMQKTVSPFNSPPVDWSGNETEYNQKLRYYELY